MQSIKNQTYRKIEVLVVDGESSDNTVAIANKYGVKIVESHKRDRSHQRNIGLLNAEGELLLLIDSDEVLNHKLVEECINKVYNKKLHGLFISTIDTGWTYLGKSRCLGNIINLKKRHDIKIPNSALRFYSKDVSKSVQYEEDVIVGEDIIFALEALKQGFKIGRCKYSLLHYATEGLSNIFRKKYVYGKNFKRLKEKAKKFNLIPSIQYAKVGLFYFRHLFTFKKHAKYLPGFSIVKLVEMLGLILGYIFASSYR